MSFKDLNHLKLAFGWLALFTVFCFTNSVLTIVFQWYGTEKGLFLTFLLPFMNTALFILIIMFYALALFLFKGKKIGYRSLEYIWGNYPHIAKQIDPDEIYAPHPVNSKDRWGIIIGGLLLLIFALVVWFKPSKFKDAFIVWLSLPILLLIVGIVISVLYRLYLRLSKGEQYAKEYFERMKQKSAEARTQRNNFQRYKRRRLFRSKQEINAKKAFLRGELDDGSDERLNQIKFYMKYMPWLMMWAFFLTPAVWIFNITLVAIFYWSK